MSEPHGSPWSGNIVLADANVLYSRVLRDYLLYAADAEVFTIMWSRRILQEVTEHLTANIVGFTTAGGERLIDAMNHAFPYAEVEPTDDEYKRLAKFTLPDEDDRHVLAAALTAEADTVCTANLKDFPTPVLATLGLVSVSPDALLTALIDNYPAAMFDAHRTTVAHLPGASNDSTMTALRRAAAPVAADHMAHILASESRH